MFAYKSPVLPLVKEKAGLLAFCPIDNELVPVLKHDSLILHEVLPAVHISVNKLESGLERRSTGALVINSLQGVPIDLAQSFRNLLLGTEHSHGMSLQNAYTVIIVDYKARKIISLTVYKPIAIGKGSPVSRKTRRDAHRKGTRYHYLPEIRAEHI